MTYTQTWDYENRLVGVVSPTLTITFTYDADGALVKKEEAGETTHYPGQHYEKNVTSGEATSYYYFASGRVAMRQHGVLYFISGDHLGTTSAIFDASGALHGQSRSYPYGTERWATGAVPTDYRFTGQRLDDRIHLYMMGVRWYDSSLGSWTSPDSMVPNLAIPQAFNRFAYVYNSPLNFVDPTGYDPLDKEWEDAYRKAHGGNDPTDADRQARLYSLLFPGPVSGQTAWIKEDWVSFTENRAEAFTEYASERESLVDFASELDRLSAWYSAGEEEQFVWAIALLYAGVPYGTKRAEVLLQGFGGSRVQVPQCAGQRLQCGWLGHGMGGFSPLVAGASENTHHYAGELLAGYYLWGWLANGGTFLREFAQGEGEPDMLDVNMGEIAVRHGRGLVQGTITLWTLSAFVLRDLGIYVPMILRPH